MNTHPEVRRAIDAEMKSSAELDYLQTKLTENRFEFEQLSDSFRTFTRVLEEQKVTTTAIRNDVKILFKICVKKFYYYNYNYLVETEGGS